ncbi:MAG: YihA family ribosome biogenesis GTP-binding protein [Verrucomicrobia bacterium]|nr:YihA family ribosome biogenesis GTP-binding protein [Cytophagales bacterium]
MQIKSAVFLQSNVSYEKCPKPDYPEYAFIGRSNVGKSSLINMLTQKSGLAKTSQHPGKTQTINHYLINENWYLVDLPGYGYAKVSKSERAKWEIMIYDYLTKRENLFFIFVLIDSRIPPQKSDLAFMEQLGEKNLPFAMIFTKTDKQKAIQIETMLENYRNNMLETWEEMPLHFVSSAVSRNGREEVLNYIATLNEDWKTA